MSVQLSKTRRKIVLKKKQIRPAPRYSRFSIDLSDNRSNSFKSESWRLSCNYFENSSFLPCSDNLRQTSQSIRRISSSDTTRKRLNHDQASNNQIVEHNVQKINNPHSKKIQVGLPYTNLNLIEPNWWQKYEGECVESLKQGRGKLYLTNGETFEGNFKKNLAEGYGVYYRKADHSPVEGIWKRNILVQKLRP